MSALPRPLGWVPAAAALAALAALVVTPVGEVGAAPSAATEPVAQPVVAFGSAAAVGSAEVPPGASSLVAIAATPDGGGYWVASATGAVYNAGDAPFGGALANVRLAAPMVGLAPTPDGQGYWLAAADGGVFAFGDAPFLGALTGVSSPVVAMAAMPEGYGYWLVTRDGRVFSFGDAAYHGGPASALAPVVGMAATPDGAGYWLAAADGGVFSFGNARFSGSLGSVRLAAPVIGMAATPDGGGYWLVGTDGGVFTFGDASFAGASPGGAPVVAVAGRVGGYWVARGRDPLGPPVAAFVATRSDNVTAAVYDVSSGETFTFRPQVVEHTASTVKVDILATLLQQAALAHRSLTPSEQSDAVPMITESSDNAADALWVSDGGAGPVGDFERSAGMGATVPPDNGVWGKTTTNAADRLTMVRDVVFPNPLLSDAARGYILDLMEHVTPSQDWGATGGVPAGVTVALKNGFSIINGAWQVNTEGWVSGQGRDYLIAVLTDGNPSEVYGIQTIDQISTLVWDALG